MNELFLFTPLTCLGLLVSRQSFRRRPWRLCLQTSGVFRMRPRGLTAAGFGARAGIAPTRAPEARAPLAKPTAPVALQQSRILRATLDARLQSTGHQSIAAARRRNPVLFRLPVRFCSVSVRFCSGPDRCLLDDVFWMIAAVGFLPAKCICGRGQRVARAKKSNPPRERGRSLDFNIGVC